MHEDEKPLQSAMNAPVTPDPLAAPETADEQASASTSRVLVVLFVVLLFLLVVPTVLGVQGAAGGCGGG